MASGSWLAKTFAMEPSGGADANTKALIARHGPFFRVAVNSAGGILIATVAGVDGYHCYSVRTGNMFHFDNSMATPVVIPGTSPPSSAENILIGP